MGVSGELARNRKLMIRSVITLLFLSFAFAGYSQWSNNSPIPKNAFYLEGKSGNGTVGVGYFSANYDRRFGARSIPCVRLGFGVDFDAPVFGIPTSIAWLTNPKGKHHFEEGVGITHRIELFEGNTYYDPFSMITLMYRYHSKSGFLLRTGINYYGYSWVIFYPTQINLAVSLGYTF